MLHLGAHLLLHLLHELCPELLSQFCFHLRSELRHNVGLELCHAVPHALLGLGEHFFAGSSSELWQSSDLHPLLKLLLHAWQPIAQLLGYGRWQRLGDSLLQRFVGHCTVLLLALGLHRHRLWEHTVKRRRGQPLDTIIERV